MRRSCWGSFGFSRPRLSNLYMARAGISVWPAETVDWRIFSDLDMTLEYGHFIPGDAYPAADNNNEDYLAVSVTHTF